MAGAEYARISIGRTMETVAGASLAESGSRKLVGSGMVVGAVLTNDRASVEILLGAVINSVALVSIPHPPISSQSIEAYITSIRSICATYELPAIICRDDIASLLDNVGIATTSHTNLDRSRGGQPRASEGEGFRLVQFTSGTSGAPRGIELNDAALGANVEALLCALQPRPGDASVSWLPLSHDMGLVGMLITSISAMSPRWVGGGSIVLLDPSDFLRRPSSWFEVLSERQATFTAGPDFGYRLAALRRPAATLDLRHLRCAIVGGEVVRTTTLERVFTAFKKVGMSSMCLCPAYGMAEVGLAVTMTPPDEPWRSRRLEMQGLTGSGRRSGRAVDVVASGPPLPGYRIVHPDGAFALGDVHIVGPSTGSNAEMGKPLVSSAGIFETTDVAFRDSDGWLYVVGRRDDQIVVRGKNYFAPLVEGTIGDVVGVRHGRVAAINAFGGELVIAYEPSRRTHNPELVNQVRLACVRLLGAPPDRVVELEKGRLPFTSSGKLRRAALRSLLLEVD